MAEKAEDIFYVRGGNNNGYAYVVFNIKGRYWEYPVHFRDKVTEISRIAHGYTVKGGKIVPPAPGKALVEAKRLANGNEKDITSSEVNFGLPAEEKVAVWPKTPKRVEKEMDRYNTCPSCGGMVEDDYCQKCGWSRVSNWYIKTKKAFGAA